MVDLIDLVREYSEEVDLSVKERLENVASRSLPIYHDRI